MLERVEAQDEKLKKLEKNVRKQKVKIPKCVTKHLEKDETKTLESSVNELKDGLGKTAMGAIRLTGTMAKIVVPRAAHQVKKLSDRVFGFKMSTEKGDKYLEKVVPAVKESGFKISQGFNSMVGNFQKDKPAENMK